MTWPIPALAAWGHLTGGAEPISPEPKRYAVPQIDRDALIRHTRELLVLLGQDPDRPGLADTPRRVADMWIEFLSYDPGRTGTTFEAVSADQLVAVKGLRVWSLCEHHLLPFWCDVAIGYLPRERVLGLSKFGRIAQRHAHRLQLQEQLVTDIAAEVQELAQTPDVAVAATGEHLCMAMRGVAMPHRMISSAMLGRFRDRQALRAEFLALTR